MQYNLKELVAGNQVRFVFFRDGELWYEVVGTDFQFPISGDDLKGATFKAEDKAILFMRWIRRYIKMLELENLSKPNNL